MCFTCNILIDIFMWNVTNYQKYILPRTQFVACLGTWSKLSEKWLNQIDISLREVEKYSINIFYNHIDVYKLY